MKTLIAIVGCGLIGLAVGCGGGGSDDSSANPVSESTDAPQTAPDSKLPGTAEDDDQSGVRDASEAVEYNKAYDPMLLLVHLPTAIDRRKDQVPSDHTGWVKEFRGDGAISLKKVVNGVDNGPQVQFYNQTTPMAAFHRVNGKIHGLYRFWDRQGNLKSQMRYEHGNKLAE